jgi:predicted RNase H-like HicB family nuclease
METHYPMNLHWSDEDDAFVVLVPDLPSCFSDGATREEAVRNAETVVRTWIETARALGRPVPPPSVPASR